MNISFFLTLTLTNGCIVNSTLMRSHAFDKDILIFSFSHPANNSMIYLREFKHQ